MSTEELDWFKSSYSSGEGGDCLEVAYNWRKSSYSGGEGGTCLEVAYPWRKSSHSTGEGGECVELSSCPHAIHIRDSKNPTGPTLSITPASWSRFLPYAKA